VAPAAHAEDWHLALVVRGDPSEGYEITNGNPENPHGCVTPFVFSRERAALMAAAPTMYRALQAMVEAFERPAFKPFLVRGEADLLSAARSALALAQGAAPTGGAITEDNAHG
jgi:hypothetical protein